MMNIALVNRRFFESSGPERYMFNITERLEKEGHTIFPFSVRRKWNNSSDFAKYFVSPPAGKDILYFKDYRLNLFQKLRLAANVVYSLEAKRKIARLLNDHKIDLVYLLSIVNDISPSVIHATKKLNIPIIMRLSDFYLFCPEYRYLRDGTVCRECDSFGYKRAFKYQCVQKSLSATGIRVLSMYIHRWLKIYELVDAFIVPSRCMKEAAIAAGFLERRIYHIPSFFDCSTIIPCYENDGYFLYFGRLDRDKGVINLLKAYEIGKFTTPLNIVGNSSDGEGQRLKAYSEKRGLTNIKFLGFKKWNDLLPLIQRSMFTVVPSVCMDNSPMSILESMACGKPVIGSNLGGISEQITSQCGILVHPNTPYELAAAISTLLSSRVSLPEMGRNCRERVEKKYSIENHYAQLKRVIESVV